MGKTFSYDSFNDDFDHDYAKEHHRNNQNSRKRQVKRKLDDYLEQRQLRKHLGEDDFSYRDH
ncbi:PA3496 family putative envelope integrity protein [Pseudoalteromonas phenolica]|uniref:PA3496 family putative envelope integrity protein n=1 Tax=Pseudoalteromonas phenolica TaxID=161398 RepID=UPI00110BF017|nr:hypothetical protein [Pseudoalteromonas phenolica]TMO53703.1 hypothetical protein CWC21_18655 [Pseudoalteromonas phenolica]